MKITKSKLDHAPFTTFDCSNDVIFHKTKEAFGGLSNMCAGYALSVNGIDIRTSEALFQAMKYPNNPDVQKAIIEEKSPLGAKMKSKSFNNYVRKDWFDINVDVMYWCLRVKLSQNFDKFIDLLISTGGAGIVEFSYKDKFWGAVPDGKKQLSGRNVLGVLLEILRGDCHIKTKQALTRFPLIKCMSAVNIDNFLLYGDQIEEIN